MAETLAGRPRLAGYRFGLRLGERGSVVSVGDGIAWIRGLPSAAMDEILDFADGSRGMVFHLSGEMLGAILLHQTERLTAGTEVHRGLRGLGIPVGDALLGRIVDPLGSPLDGAAAPACSAEQALEILSPPITAREFVHDPLYTGIKIIDCMVPIGRGQRQLIVGDKGLGRSALAIDTVINQRGGGVYCVYVMVGQKRSTVVATLETLRRFGAMDYTTVVVGEASALPGMQYLAPFAGCAIAEAWMNRGRDTLVVYDDLSTHARSYRELSLLLRRPPGREAYPGDIFYLHARLLERATCLNAEHGGGRLTGRPIVATQPGDIASYIPPNLISITDGQLYLNQSLFDEGFRPAIDVARSVSRIGGKAQHARIQQEAGRMKLDYLQFLELEVFTRFGARLEASMEMRIRRGRMLRELLKQDRLRPLPPIFQMAWLVAFNEGLFDDIAPEGIAGRMHELEAWVDGCGLTLEHTREQWLSGLATFFGHGAGQGR